MKLVQLIYASVPNIPIGSFEMIQILEPSRANNSRDDITGMLTYSGSAFLQVLEGAEAPVSRAFARITADPRHGAIELIGILPAAARTFPDWTMGFAGFATFKRDAIERYAGGRLHGGSLEPARALALLIEFAGQRTRSAA